MITIMAVVVVAEAEDQSSVEVLAALAEAEVAVVDSEAVASVVALAVAEVQVADSDNRCN